jgi:hypothetical protein
MERVPEGFAELPVVVVEPMFVYARMPGDLDPEDRHEQFAEPLDALLSAANLGCVTGGGSLLSAPDEEGMREVVFCGIDFLLTHPRDGIALIIKELGRLHAPPGTTLEFQLGEQPFEIGIDEQAQ